MSKTLSKNVLNLAIKNRGQAYSDAIEFKGANRVDVYTYKFLSGVVKNTGLILQIPRNSIFRVTKDEKKIMNVGISDSQLKWEKAMNANGTKKNGEIYIDHPHIAKARLLYAHILTGDLDAIRALYADNARISDVMNSEFDSFISPDKEIANIKNFYKNMRFLILLKVDILIFWIMQVQTQKRLSRGGILLLKTKNPERLKNIHNIRKLL